MKKSAKKRGKGRPKQAAKLKALVMTVSIKPEHNRKIERVMKSRNLDRSKAVQWLIENCGEG
jgi:hypothetical protein